MQRWKPLFAWLPVETLIHERQAGYYEALNAANTQGEATVFVEFMLSVIQDALLEIKENQSRHVGVNVGVNVGKENAVLHILRRYPQASAKMVADMAQLSSRQVERILAQLKRKGRLIRHGSPKAGYWQVMEDEPEGAPHARI